MRLVDAAQHRAARLHDISCSGSLRVVDVKSEGQPGGVHGDRTIRPWPAWRPSPRPAQAGGPRWPCRCCRRSTPRPGPASPSAAAAIGAALVLPLLGAQAIRVIVQRCRALLAVQRNCQHLPGTSSLVVVDTDDLDAFTTPQRRGRIVVTTGLLRALDPAERRVVLAHEASHLEHRHPWWVLAAELAAAVNPLLGPTARTAAHAVERWATKMPPPLLPIVLEKLAVLVDPCRPRTRGQARDGVELRVGTFSTEVGGRVGQIDVRLASRASPTTAFWLSLARLDSGTRPVFSIRPCTLQSCIASGVVDGCTRRPP